MEFLEELLNDPEFKKIAEETREELRASKRTGRPNGRPNKYPHLGDSTMMRVPSMFVKDLRELFRELDRAGQRQDPTEVLSKIIENLGEINDNLNN